MNTQSEGENVSRNNSTNSEVERFSQEVNRLRERAEFWDSWNIRLLFVAGLAALFLVVTAVGVSRSNRALIRSSDNLDKAKDRKLQIDLKSKDDAIAEADRRGEEAKARAAQASLETEKLKQTLAWRILSTETASQLQKVLATKPGSVNLRYIDGDPESLYLAIQFSEILKRAKWSVGAGALKMPSLVFGILLPDADSVDARALREAFTNAKVSFSPDKLQPQTTVGFAISTIPNAPMLLVGSKKPPNLP